MKNLIPHVKLTTKASNNINDPSFSPLMIRPVSKVNKALIQNMTTITCNQCFASIAIKIHSNEENSDQSPPNNPTNPLNSVKNPEQSQPQKTNTITFDFNPKTKALIQQSTFRSKRPQLKLTDIQVSTPSKIDQSPSKDNSTIWNEININVSRNPINNIIITETDELQIGDQTDNQDNCETQRKKTNDQTFNSSTAKPPILDERFY